MKIPLTLFFAFLFFFIVFTFLKWTFSSAFREVWWQGPRGLVLQFNSILYLVLETAASYPYTFGSRAPHPRLSRVPHPAGTC